MASYGFKGWIKLWRNQMNTILYHSEPFDKWHAWIDLCLMADESGTVETSLRALKTRWSWSHTRKVVDFLGTLSGTDSVTVVSTRNKGTLIRINTTFLASHKSSKKNKSGTVSGTISGFEEVSFKEDSRPKAPANSPSTAIEENKNWLMEDDFDD